MKTTRKSKKLAKRILLVEDDNGTLGALTLLLGRRGHEVTSVKSLRGALEAASTHADFDILICDIGLPDGDGWELMTTLQAQYGMPGIALTGYSTPSDWERSAAAGFAFHLVKPIEPQELYAAIEKVTKIVKGNGPEPED